MSNKLESFLHKLASAVRVVKRMGIYHTLSPCSQWHEPLPTEFDFVSVDQRCSALASKQITSNSFRLWFCFLTVVSISEGLETFCRLQGTVHPHGFEVHGSSSGIHFDSSK